jgi:hypothetical protein
VVFYFVWFRFAKSVKIKPPKKIVCNNTTMLFRPASKPRIVLVLALGALLALGLIWCFWPQKSKAPAKQTISYQQPASEDGSAETADKGMSAPSTEDAARPAVQPPSTGVSGVDIHAIPLGDGKVSTAPKVGYVYSCRTSFRGGGADHAGNWINGKTWDLSKKLSVQGSVSWPSATFSAAIQGVTRFLQGNGLPVGSLTGIFPIQQSDPAYQYDRNPNSIKEYKLALQLPAEPVMAAAPSCVPMGAIGYALNGVAIFNALDDAGRDAVAHEVQDRCSGHPQQQGQYHYHGPSDCMPHASEPNALVGFAVDGFGIYSMYDAAGREYTDADLDACHGITGEIAWDGQMVSMYHYVLTREYPYTIGCFRGTPAATQPLNAKP